MNGEVKVTIDYERIADDARWDGLKGYLTNTAIPMEQVYSAYHNLWHVERAFRIAKSKIEIRPRFHFTRKRIEAHVCICFVALKVYKELERMLRVSGIKMSVDKVLALAKTITTIQIKLPLNRDVYTKTMLMARHQRIAKHFDEDFWVTQCRSQEKTHVYQQLTTGIDYDNKKESIGYIHKPPRTQQLRGSRR